MTVAIPLALLLVAAWHDVRSREIPDWISLTVAAWAVVVAVMGWQAGGWVGLLLGAALGFMLTSPLFWLGGLGGGDVKLVVALGACLGPSGLLQALFWVAIVGGVLALIAKLRKQADFAYVPAILMGLAIYSAQSGACLYAR
jgi:prepilin peptidase CpaA